MIASRHIACLLPFALAACGGEPAVNESAVSPTAAADLALVQKGYVPAEIAAARSYLGKFTTADASPCFGDAALGTAAMEGPGGATDGPPIKRVVVAVDGSGSMAGKVGGRTKLELAREATLAFVDGLPDSVEASLLVFGQQGDNSAGGKAKSCAAVDVLAPMSRDRASLNAAVGQVKAVGWTPLAGGLERAQALLDASTVPGEQVIYVVSDGLETCGGDPVAMAQRINGGGTRAVINIVGFGLPTSEVAALQAVAGAGGGRFVNITDDGGFRRSMAGFRDANRRMMNRVRAGNAQADNFITTGAAITRAELCVGRIVHGEEGAVSADLTAYAQRGQTAPAPRHVVFAVLKERHDALVARREAYATRLRGARDRVNATVEDQPTTAR